MTPELLPKAVDTALNIQHQGERAKAISSLVNKLTPELLPEALAVTRQIKSEGCRDEFLMALTDKLTPEFLPEALAVARQTEDEYERLEILIPWSGKFPEILPEIMAIFEYLIDDDEYWYEPFLALADKLTPEFLPEALATLKQIPDDEPRAEVTVALAKKLTPEFLPEVLAIADQFYSKCYRTDVLNALAEPLSQMPKTELYPLWENTIHSLSLDTRPDLFSNIAALTAVIFSLGGEEAIENTAIAIQDVSRWWQ